MDRFPARLVHPHQFNQPVGDRLRQRRFQVLLLHFYVQHRHPPGRCDQPEDPKRRADLQGRLGVGGGNMPDQGLLPAQVCLGLGVEERLPRQRGQLRGGQPQHHPQPSSALLHRAQASPVGAIDRTAEQRFEQPLANLPHRLLHACYHAPRRHAGSKDRRLKLTVAREDLRSVHHQTAGRLPATGRTYHPHLITARLCPGADLDFDAVVHPGHPTRQASSQAPPRLAVSPSTLICNDVVRD